MLTPAQQLVPEWAQDYSVWARECVVFRGKDSQPIRHAHPHPGQLKIREGLQDRLRIILKARQVGATSELASLFVHRALFRPGSSILVLAQTFEGVRGISAVYAHIVEHLPAILRKGLFRARVTLTRIEFPGLRSEIVFSTANTVSVRGTPRQGCHITEAAFVQDLRATLTAMQPTVYGPLVVESTANGPGEFHQLWSDPHVDKVFVAWTDDLTCVSDVPLPEDLTPLERQYVERHQLTPRQASWFVHKLRQTNWESFKQEHPITPDEAFILGGDRFFSRSWFPGDTTRIPARHQHAKPLAGRKYAIGADCASGSKKGDRSAAVVLDVTDPANYRTVCSYADRVAPTAFAKVLAALSKEYLGAVVCVERNAGYGLSVLDGLRQASTKLYHTKVFDTQTKAYSPQYGWNTTRDTRPLLLAALQDAVNNQRYIPEDPRIEEEFNAFRFDDKGKPQALLGCHDDLVFAAALAIQAAGQAHDTTLYAPALQAPPQGASFSEIAQFEMASGELWEEDSDYE